METTKEIWKNLPEYVGIEVSNLGRVRKNTRKHHNDVISEFSKDRDGYCRCTVFLPNGKCTSQPVHRLVAKAFIENPENKTCVNHKDNDRANNRVENLEWVTCSENQIHAYRVLNRKRKSDHSPRPTKRRFTKEQVLDIRNSKKSQSELAREYRTSQNVIWCIVNRKTYQEI
jgi:hypothetical protein